MSVVCELFVLIGLVAQGVGVTYLAGWETCAIMLGTEIALIGMAGIIRAAG